VSSLEYADVPVNRSVGRTNLQGQPERVWGADAVQFTTTETCNQEPVLIPQRKIGSEKYERVGEDS
jgi:hypothetical protein